MTDDRELCAVELMGQLQLTGVLGAILQPQPLVGTALMGNTPCLTCVSQPRALPPSAQHFCQAPRRVSSSLTKQYTTTSTPILLLETKALSWSLTGYVTEDDLGLLILLSPPPKCSDYRPVTPRMVY